MPVAGTATSSANTAMYLAVRDESHRATRSLTGRFATRLAVTEAVRPVPVPQVLDRVVCRDPDTEMEPGERSRAVRHRAQSDPAREMKEAVAGGDGAASDIDDGVAVEHGFAGLLEVEDLRAHLDRL